MKNSTSMKWDLFIRTFHWSLVLAVLLTYLSGEFDVEELHGWFGYVLLVLIVARLIWGFIGSINARFITFIYSPRETLAYIASALRNKPIHYNSHNPAGAMMVFAKLGVLIMLVVSGLIYEGWGEYEGPLWSLHIVISDQLGLLAKHVHRLLPELLLVMIAMHLIGVIVATIQHKESFVRAMWYGRDKQ
ncbi:cytochrome b/b6 domain-containing protein [Mariprofundus sp. EBB-1]|uniref:cytochrome b/b6 domain-containing protein n=1 Tax=Mariprofundus sp. EBB-1 TaxID=2650971 RepID=UPI00137A96DF|nr:cytochrome b/b6 domain-containing protein [Mariprofundus sp. EBB-1]